MLVTFRHYWPLTENIYRFVPASLELIKNFHTVDERYVLSPHSVKITLTPSISVGSTLMLTSPAFGSSTS